MYHSTNKIEKAHQKDIWYSAWSNVNDYIVTASLDGTAKIWDTSNGKLECIRTSPMQRMGITSAHICNNKTQFITCCQDAMIHIYDINDNDNECVETNSIDTGLMESFKINVSPDDQHIITGTSKGCLNMFSISTGEQECSIDCNSKFILDNVFASDCNTVATVGVDGKLNIIDINASSIVHSIQGHSLPTRSVCFSHNDKLVMTASDDRHVNIYDTVSGKVITSYSHSGMALSVASCVDQKHFLVGCSDSKVLQWDIGSTGLIHTYDAVHSEPVWSVATNAEKFDQKFVSAGEDGILQMYEC